MAKSHGILTGPKRERYEANLAAKKARKRNKQNNMSARKDVHRKRAAMAAEAAASEENAALAAEGKAKRTKRQAPPRATTFDRIRAVDTGVEVVKRRGPVILLGSPESSGVLQLSLLLAAKSYPYTYERRLNEGGKDGGAQMLVDDHVGTGMGGSNEGAAPVDPAAPVAPVAPASSSSSDSSSSSSASALSGGDEEKSEAGTGEAEGSAGKGEGGVTEEEGEWERGACLIHGDISFRDMTLAMQYVKKRRGEEREKERKREREGERERGREREGERERERGRETQLPCVVCVCVRACMIRKRRAEKRALPLCSVDPAVPLCPCAPVVCMCVRWMCGSWMG